MKNCIKTAFFALSFVCFASEGLDPLDARDSGGLDPQEAARRVVETFGREKFDALGNDGVGIFDLMQKEGILVLQDFDDETAQRLRNALAEASENPVGKELLKLSYALVANARNNPEARKEEEVIVFEKTPYKTGVRMYMTTDFKRHWRVIGVNLPIIDNEGYTESRYTGISPDSNNHDNDSFVLVPYRLSDILFHELLHWWRGSSGINVRGLNEPPATELIKSVYNFPGMAYEDGSVENAVAAWGNDEEFSTITGIYRKNGGGLAHYFLSEVNYNRQKGASSPYSSFDRISHGLETEGTGEKGIEDITSYLRRRNNPIYAAHRSIGGGTVRSLLSSLSPELLFLTE